MNIKLQENEKLIKEGKANRTRFIGSQGGHLYITNKRIVFIGHGKNFGEGTISINLSDVMYCRKAWTATIFNLVLPVSNAFKVVKENGESHCFTVYGRKKWIYEIEQLLNK